MRSIAFQMARSNAAVRERLLMSSEAGLAFGHDDTRAIWARLFKGVILQVRSHALRRPKDPSYKEQQQLGLDKLTHLLGMSTAH